MNEASFLATIGRPAIELFDGQPASNRMAAARKVYHSDYNDAASGKYTGQKREMTPLVEACSMLPSEDCDAAALLAAACTKTDEMHSEGPGIAQHTKGMDGGLETNRQWKEWRGFSFGGSTIHHAVLGTVGEQNSVVRNLIVPSSGGSGRAARRGHELEPNGVEAARAEAQRRHPGKGVIDWCDSALIDWLVGWLVG